MIRANIRIRQEHSAQALSSCVRQWQAYRIGTSEPTWPSITLFWNISSPRHSNRESFKTCTRSSFSRIFATISFLPLLDSKICFYIRLRSHAWLTVRLIPRFRWSVPSVIPQMRALLPPTSTESSRDMWSAKNGSAPAWSKFVFWIYQKNVIEVVLRGGLSVAVGAPTPLDLRVQGRGFEIPSVNLA